jgi:hypothetical protein
MSPPFQGRRMSQARNQLEVGSKQCSDFQRTKWRYIADDRTLYNHRCESVKCDVPVIFSVLLKYVINELEWIWLS